MNIFVTKNEEIIVDVFVWEIDDTIDASNIRQEVPEKIEPQIVKFVFRKPCYKDSSRIMKKANIQNVSITEGKNDISADLMGMQDEMLRSQLVKIIDGEKVILADENTVNELEPKVARAAIAAIFEKVGI